MTAHNPYPLSALAPTPTRRRPPWTYLIAAAVAVLLLGGAAWWWTSRDITVTGTLTLSDQGGFVESGGGCAGEGGYSDMRGGARVVVSDAAGKTLALGSLSTGRPGQLITECVFSFKVDVPRGHDFYRVTIGDRDPMEYAAEDLMKPLDLTLGGR